MIIKPGQLVQSVGCMSIILGTEAGITKLFNPGLRKLVFENTDPG